MLAELPLHLLFLLALYGLLIPLVVFTVLIELIRAKTKRRSSVAGLCSRASAFCALRVRRTVPMFRMEMI